jgi:hypothetical protein
LKFLYRDKIPRLSEPVFVNVYGALESIPTGRESIHGLLKRFTNTGKTLPATKRERKGGLLIFSTDSFYLKFEEGIT